MNKVSMSLHRVMAEIKSLEAKLVSTSSLQLMKVVQGDPRDDAAKADRLQFTIDAKSSLDKVTNMIKNLAELKAARNRANSVVTVTVNGLTITIDEALSQKAALQYKQTLIDTMFSQVVAAQRAGLAAEKDIDNKVASQLATMFGASRKATEDEVKVIQDGFARSLKPVILAPEGFKTTLENLKNDVSEFEKEIDFVLSEANATNKVDVNLV